MRELVAAAVAAAAPKVVGAAETGGEEVPAGSLDEAVWLSVAGLLSLEPALRRLVLDTWLEGRARPAASRAGVLAVESLLSIEGSAQRSLAGGCRVNKEYDRLFLLLRGRVDREKACANLVGSGAAAGRSAPVPLPVPGEAEWHGSRVLAERVPAFRMPDAPLEAFFDAVSLLEPLTVRGPRPGDRMRPFGAAGSRKLQDIFVDLRVPAAQRAGWPVVLSGERIVWVCGLVQAEEGRITERTDDFIRLSWERT
jgi:tRNA(Ile)-lysidine synthase